jgi:periplasmic divalent cation tolerance protein
MAEFLQVTFTIDDEAAARRLARGIVEARLGACAQVIGPLHSVYRWRGAVEDATEWYCHVKTTGDRYAELAAHIREHHPYDTPEVIATPIEHGDAEYLAWVRRETRDD